MLVRPPLTDAFQAADSSALGDHSDPWRTWQDRGKLKEDAVMMVDQCLIMLNDDLECSWWLVLVAPFRKTRGKPCNFSMWKWCVFRKMGRTNGMYYNVWLIHAKLTLNYSLIHTHHLVNSMVLGEIFDIACRATKKSTKYGEFSAMTPQCPIFRVPFQGRKWILLQQTGHQTTNIWYI